MHVWLGRQLPDICRWLLPKAECRAKYFDAMDQHALALCLVRNQTELKMIRPVIPQRQEVSQTPMSTDNPVRLSLAI